MDFDDNESKKEKKKDKHKDKHKHKHKDKKKKKDKKKDKKLKQTAHTINHDQNQPYQYAGDAAGQEFAEYDDFIVFNEADQEREGGSTRNLSVAPGSPRKLSVKSFRTSPPPPRPEPVSPPPPAPRPEPVSRPPSYHEPYPEEPVPALVPYTPPPTRRTTRIATPYVEEPPITRPVSYTKSDCSRFINNRFDCNRDLLNIRRESLGSSTSKKTNLKEDDMKELEVYRTATKVVAFIGTIALIAFVLFYALNSSHSNEVDPRLRHGYAACEECYDRPNRKASRKPKRMKKKCLYDERICL